MSDCKLSFPVFLRNMVIRKMVHNFLLKLPHWLWTSDYFLLLSFFLGKWFRKCLQGLIGSSQYFIATLELISLNPALSLNFNMKMVYFIKRTRTWTRNFRKSGPRTFRKSGSYAKIHCMSERLIFADLRVLISNVKGNVQFIFFCNPQKSSVNVCIMEILKSTVTKKVIVCFNNLGEWRKLLEVAAFVIFPASIMVFFRTFKIHQGFRGHFLNELRGCFKYDNGFLEFYSKNTQIRHFWSHN